MRAMLWCCESLKLFTKQMDRLRSTQRYMLRTIAGPRLHSNAVFPVKYNGKSLPLSTISNVFGFFVLYFLLIFVSTLIMMSLGLDLNEALGNCISSIGDVGPGFGRFTSSYSSVPIAGKWLMSFLMLVGRLEIYTIFLLFIPNFWKN